LSRHWRLVLPAVLAGLLAGVWIGSRCERAAGRRMRREGPRPERVMKMLRRELSLTSEQMPQVRAILDAKRPKFQAVRKQEQAAMAALRAEIDKDIEPLLDEGQKKKQIELRARWEKRAAESSPPVAK